MALHSYPESGAARAQTLLPQVTELPCPELEALHERFIGTPGLKVMLAALTAIVRLAVDGRLRRLGRQGTLLFYGPPGTGKSTLGLLLPHLWALTTGATGRLVRANLHGLASSQHGQSQKNVGLLFESLRSLCSDGRPLFAVFDELETLATDRNEISGKTSPIDARSTVNAFLEHLDHKPSNCLILGTTNGRHRLDAAVISRFDFAFAVGLPDATARLKALSAFVRIINPCSPCLRIVPKPLVERLSAVTDGFSFREMEALPLWSMALHGGDMTLDPRQLVAAGKFLKNSKFNHNGGAE